MVNIGRFNEYDCNNDIENYKLTQFLCGDKIKLISRKELCLMIMEWLYKKIFHYIVRITSLILLNVTVTISISAEVNQAKLISCSAKDTGLCRFYYKSTYIKLKQQPEKLYKFYYYNKLIYRGRIIEVRYDKATNGQFFTAYGYWKNGYRKYRNKNLEFTYIRLRFSLVRWFMDIKLRDDFNEPVYHLYANIGSPDSYASGNGVTIEYLKYYRAIRVSYATYKSSRNLLLDTPDVLIKTASASYGALLGQEGSQLYLGATGTLRKADVTQFNNPSESDFFLSILPVLGVRFTSEKNYVLTYDVMSNINIGRSLESLTGPLNQKTSIFNAKSVSSVVGLGFGL